MKVKARTFSGTTSNEVTQREIANRALARKAATEGFVLLKNEGHFLPAPKGGKIALYGAGAVKTIKGGTGSGDVNERDYVTIAQGMKNAGYEVTTEGWLDSYVKVYDQAREDWKAAILKKAEKMESPNAFFEAVFVHSVLHAVWRKNRRGCSKSRRCRYCCICYGTYRRGKQRPF